MVYIFIPLEVVNLVDPANIRIMGLCTLEMSDHLCRIEVKRFVCGLEAETLLKWPF